MIQSCLCSVILASCLIYAWALPVHSYSTQLSIVRVRSFIEPDLFHNNVPFNNTTLFYLISLLCKLGLRLGLEGGHCLRCVSSPSLIVRRTRLSTVGDRALPVAASHVWNDLPQHFTAAESLPVFCSRLKTQLFRCCFP